MIALFGVATLIIQAAAPAPRWALQYRGNLTGEKLTLIEKIFTLA